MRKRRTKTTSEGILFRAAANPLRGRRGIIVNTLRYLIQEKGYADVTITDLAKRSGMSVSHFLYYFPSREAVLEELCQQMLTSFFLHVNSHRDDAPEHRMEHLVRLIFTKGTFPRSEFGFMVEILALSMHHPRVRKLLDEYTVWMNDYLLDLFRHVPRAPGLSAEDAATIAAAIWGGLLHNALFDKNLKDDRARALFRQMLFSLAGMNPEPRRQTRRLGSRNGAGGIPMVAIWPSSKLGARGMASSRHSSLS